MSLPVSLNTITVTGSYTDGAGNPQGGIVTFCPTSALTDPGGQVVVGQVPIVAQVSHSTGQFSQAGLACTDNLALLPNGWEWTVNVAVPGAQAVFSALLPSTLGSTVDISALTPAAGVIAASGQWFLPNASSQPGTPFGGGNLFCWNGNLYWRGSSGTLTLIAPA